MRHYFFILVLIFCNFSSGQSKKQKEEIKCPPGADPTSFGFTINFDGRSYVGSAKLTNKRMVSEFGGISADTYFSDSTSLSSYSSYGNSPPSKPRSRLSPPAGALIGKQGTITSTVFIETDPRKSNFGKVKAAQFRVENSANIYFDYTKPRKIRPLISMDKNDEDNDSDDTEIQKYEKRIEDLTVSSEPQITEMAKKIQRFATCCPNESVEGCYKLWEQKDKESPTTEKYNGASEKKPKPQYPR